MILNAFIRRQIGRITRSIETNQSCSLIPAFSAQSAIELRTGHYTPENNAIVNTHSVWQLYCYTLHVNRVRSWHVSRARQDSNVFVISKVSKGKDYQLGLYLT